MKAAIAIVENRKLTTDEKIRSIMKLAKRDALKIQNRKEVKSGSIFNRVYGLLCCN